MKLIISFLFLVSFNAHSHQILILYTQGNVKNVQVISHEFIDNYNIPPSLVKSQIVLDCKKKNGEKKYLILCLDKKKELVIINTSSQIIKTLNVFKRL